jgi:hypothetical protein
VLGGPLNYGRYFGVRGAHADLAASNVDVMIVTPGFGWMDEVLSGISALPGCSRATRTIMEQRAASDGSTASTTATRCSASAY